MSKQDLAREIVKAMEAGFDKYLNRSIKYSPFRLFYRLFKNANPRVMNYVRSIIRNDIDQLLSMVDNFNSDFFMPNGVINSSGKKLLGLCYNIGQDVLRKKLTVVTIFRIINNASFRDIIYSSVLEDVSKATTNLIAKGID